MESGRMLYGIIKEIVPEIVMVKVENEFLKQ